MNAAETALAKLVSARLGSAGRVSDLAIGHGTVRLTLDLAGQGGPVELEAHGLRWTLESGHVVVAWERAGSSLAWVDSLIQSLSGRLGWRVRVPDDLRSAPIKLLLPKG